MNNTRDDVILTAVKDNIYPSLQLMVLIMPSNRKSLYDGFKKVTCIDKPGMFTLMIIVLSHRLVIVYWMNILINTNIYVCTVFS